MQQGIYDFIESGTYLFGKEVNSRRALPLVNDGLKTVYRRIIYSSLDYSKMTKTATVAGQVVGNLHPHGLDSVEKAVNNLVRLGVFDGQGQFGCKMIDGDNIEAAASRYTECKLSDKYRKLIEPLMPYVNKVEGELDGIYEPEYLPLPLPMAFMMGGIGLGVGCNCRIPFLDTQSLIEAFKSNDPSKLKAPYGMILNYSNSELRSLWETGLGAIEYQYNVGVEWIDGNELIVISADSAEVFKPNMSVFDKYINSGKMYTIDLTDGNRVAVGIGRNARVDRHNFDECLELAKQISVNRKTYRLTVADLDGTSYIIPLKFWLKECYDNYIQLVDKMKADKLAKAQFNKSVFTFLPQVGKLITTNPDITDDEILKSIEGLTEPVLKVILTKSISQLRKKDTTKEVAKYDEEIKKWTELDSKKYTEEVMSKL